MGMYTELIFGASLKEDTPMEVIKRLKCVLGECGHGIKCKDEFAHVLSMSSYYFGVSSSVGRMWQENTSNRNWVISSRSNIKNYNNEIETFLGWIKPFIKSGSGNREMYAIVLYEDAEEPTIHYLTP